MHCSWVAAAQHHCCVVDRQCRARALTQEAWHIFCAQKIHGELRYDELDHSYGLLLPFLEVSCRPFLFLPWSFAMTLSTDCVFWLNGFLVPRGSANLRYRNFCFFGFVVLAFFVGCGCFASLPGSSLRPQVHHSVRHSMLAARN